RDWRSVVCSSDLARQQPRGMERVPEGARDRGDQSDPLGGTGHRREHGERLEGPQGAALDAADPDRLAVGEEERVEPAALGDPCQLLPVADLAEAGDGGAGGTPGRGVVAAGVREQVQPHLAAGRGAHQFFTSPPSTMRFCPVTDRAHGEAKKSTASASSAGVVTDCSGVLAAIASNTASGVAELASVVRSRPPLTMFTVMPREPRSAAKVRVSASSAAFAAV